MLLAAGELARALAEMAGSLANLAISWIASRTWASEAKDLASYSRSVNQRRSAAMSAFRTVCSREASSPRVVPSTRLRTQ